MNARPIAFVLQRPGAVILRLKWDSHKISARQARAQALHVAAEAEAATDRLGECWVVVTPKRVEQVDRVWLGCDVEVELVYDNQAEAAQRMLSAIAEEVRLKQ
jgi:hypothetical protein